MEIVMGRIKFNRKEYRLLSPVFKIIKDQIQNQWLTNYFNDLNFKYYYRQFATHPELTLDELAKLDDIQKLSGIYITKDSGKAIKLLENATINNPTIIKHKDYYIIFTGKEGTQLITDKEKEKEFKKEIEERYNTKVK